MYSNPPIEEFYGYFSEDELLHYGIKRRSGRYPWGSGKDPYQRTGDLLSRYYALADKGLSEKEIAREMHTTTTKLRVQLSYAKNQRRQLDVDRAKSLRADGLSLAEIAREMGFKNDSSVRTLLNEQAETRMKQSQVTAERLKEIVDQKGMVEVGAGVEHELGVSRTKLDQALYILELEGYDTFTRRLPQVTNPAQKTTLKVLTPPGSEYKDVYNTGEIHSVADYTVSYDNGESFHKPFEFPTSMDSKRLKIRYKEDGGIDKDGVIEIRRGVEDLSLGESKYAQVRILVDGDRYLKGMAVYSDGSDMPDGVDVIFNTNKTKDVPMRSVLKPVKTTKDADGKEVIDRDNPFGSLIKEKGGQRYYDDPNGTYTNPTTGKKQSLSPINKRSEEGDWDGWSKSTPSQFLAKQNIKLIKQQLNLSKADKADELADILAVNNPTIKRKLLEDYADGCDKAAVTLQAAALPRQRYQVILPITSLKDTEVYAPNYKDGEKVALIRYPHGGLFEIPILKVNNKNPDGIKIIGTDAKDAVGINAKVAEQLSGADFDGDTVQVIPTGNTVNISSHRPLEGLKNFDPKVEYKIPEGNPNKVKVMTKANTQKQMGVVSNLIMDMTLKGACEEELARAVRHSMVVIDAEKHGLDYKKSESDNGIDALKRTYQGHYENGQYHEGASTLLTLAKSEQSVPKRQGSGVIDPETGKKTYKTADDLWYETSRVDKKTGEVITKQKMRTQKSTKMAETDDAYTLVSDRHTAAELAYADYANTLKSLANRARKEMKAAGTLTYSSEARKEYADEVGTLMAKLRLAQANKPREHQAQIIANTRIKEKIAADPDLADDKKMLKKVSQQTLVAARNQVGAQRYSIDVTDREWEAIQKGAITDNVLKQILDSADVDQLRERATPRSTTQISDAKKARIKAMRASGYTASKIAESLGVSESTVIKYSK